MAHDDNEGAGVELHDYIRILRKNWITILLLTLLGAVQWLLMARWDISAYVGYQQRHTKAPQVKHLVG